MTKAQVKKYVKNNPNYEYFHISLDFHDRQLCEEEKQDRKCDYWIVFKKIWKLTCGNCRKPIKKKEKWNRVWSHSERRYLCPDCWSRF